MRLLPKSVNITVMATMRTLRENAFGKINVLIIPLILVVLLLFGAGGFAIWAYGSRQDYKTNTDQKIATAVKVAQDQTSSEKDKEFVEKEKSPIRDYRGPSAYGSVVIKYPKTWSAFVTEANQSTNIVIDGYFHPSFVPGIQSGTSFALRLQVSSRPYDEELKQFEGVVKQGKVAVKPYKAANVSTASVGSRLDGTIATGKQGSMVILPMRDKTLKIWIEATQFQNDFDTIILPNMSFSP